MPTSKESALAIIGDIFAKASVVADLAHAMEAETPQLPPIPATQPTAPPAQEAPASSAVLTPAAPPSPSPPPAPQTASQKDVLAALRGNRQATPK